MKVRNCAELGPNRSVSPVCSISAVGHSPIIISMFTLVCCHVVRRERGFGQCCQNALSICLWVRAFVVMFVCIISSPCCRLLALYSPSTSSSPRPNKHRCDHLELEGTSATFFKAIGCIYPVFFIFRQKKSTFLAALSQSLFQRFPLAVCCCDCYVYDLTH